MYNLIAALILTISAQGYTKTQTVLMKNIKIEAAQVKAKIIQGVKKIEAIERSIDLISRKKTKAYDVYRASRSENKRRTRDKTLTALKKEKQVSEYEAEDLERKIEQYKKTYAALGRKYVKIRGK